MTITNEILMRTKPIIITWLAMFYCTAYAQVKSGQQEFRDGDALWRQTVNDFTFFSELCNEDLHIYYNSTYLV